MIIPSWLSGSLRYFFVQFVSVFPDSSVVKESAYNSGDPDQFLGQEDPLKKGYATHSKTSGLGLPLYSAGKESACNVGNLGSILGLGRSLGEGKVYPLQYSGLENSMDNPWGRRVRYDRATFTFTFLCILATSS